MMMLKRMKMKNEVDGEETSVQLEIKRIIENKNED